MVCLGNICRSPLAEGIMRSKIEGNALDWEVDNAGTNGYHVGEAPHRLSQKVAAMHGIDISMLRARNFSADDFEKFDLIYAMAQDVIDEMHYITGKKFQPGKIKLLMDEVYPGKHIEVPDPWYGPEPGYQLAFDMMDKACNKIIEKYSTLKKQTNSF